jgi:hypothetical protein
VGGWPSRRITIDDEAFIVETAKSRPEKLGRPFTRWSIRKLVQYLADNPTRVVKIGRERLREQSNDPDRDPAAGTAGGTVCLRSR